MIAVTQVMNLVDKWVAGGVKMRVFTDKWPDCSCAVFFYQEWFPQNSNAPKPGMHKCINFFKRTFLVHEDLHVSCQSCNCTVQLHDYNYLHNHFYMYIV